MTAQVNEQANPSSAPALIETPLQACSCELAPDQRGPAFRASNSQPGDHDHRQQLVDAENVFDELKNPWGFAGFCTQMTVVSQSSARMLLLVYHLWSLFARVFKNQGSHTEAIKSRDELWFITAKRVLTDRRKIIKLAVGGKLDHRNKIVSSASVSKRIADSRGSLTFTMSCAA